jgi:hypothetical protein
MYLLRKILMQWPRLFEIEDQKWLPQLLRNQMTDALQFLILEMKIYDPIIPELQWVMLHSKTRNVVDLCSGGTGPWDYLVGAIPPSELLIGRITLTDLFPNKEALRSMSDKNPIFDYRATPVDVLDMDVELEGVRTLFSSFHHFDTHQAVSIVQDAVNKQMPICIFEFTGRRLLNFLLTPVSMLILFTAMLFKKRLTFSRLLFSYLIPLVPLIYLWDSMVSHLRTYSQAELKAILNRVDNADSYEWEIGEATSPKTPLKNSYLIGYPKNSKESASY